MSTNPHFSLRDLLEKPDLLVTPPNGDVGDKEKILEDDSTFDFSSAFLGPVLWDKTLPFDEEDFKLESLGLQEFFDENDLLPSGGHEEQMLQPSRGSSPVSQACASHVVSPTLPPAPNFLQSANSAVAEIHETRPEPKTSYEPSTAEQEVTLVTIPGQEGFDPRKRKFTEDELKPQPMIKKSKKMYVPENLKDEQYWERRNKNNVAAKRSRDARRVKENQIAMRAAFLEKENGTLKSDLEKLRVENLALKKHLSQYEMQAKLAGNTI